MAYLSTVIPFVWLHLVVCEESFRPSNSGALISFGNFFHHKDHKLFAAKLKNEEPKSCDECLIRCIQTHGCLSVNVNTTRDDQGLYVCELLASDKYENQSNFIPSKGIAHYSIASPCEEKPCKPDREKCVPSYANYTYRCECVAGRRGKYCEIPVCDQGWLQFGDNCYLFKNDSSGQEDWNGALQACQLLRGHLVDIRNEDEWQFVKSNLQRGGTLHAQYIIGITDAANEGQWKYIDGSAVSFFKWKNGEPGGGTTENCGGIFSDIDNGSYNDGPCTHKYGRFICKKGLPQ